MARVIPFPGQGSNGGAASRDTRRIALDDPTADSVMLLATGLVCAQELRLDDDVEGSERLLDVCDTLAVTIASLACSPEDIEPDSLDSARAGLRRVMQSALREDQLLAAVKAIDDDLEGAVAMAIVILNEFSVEEHGAALDLDVDDRMYVHVQPLPQGLIRLRLAASLMVQVDRWLTLELAETLERDAVRWWFQQFQPAQKRDGSGDHAQMVRSLEFAFVERPFVTLGLTPLEDLLESGMLDERPRLAALAAAYLRSRADVWLVTSRSGDRVTLEHPLTDERFKVIDQTELEYDAGAVIIGRLIPDDDGTWTRSSGAVVLEWADEGKRVAKDLAAALQRDEPNLPRGAVIELIVHGAAGNFKLPRDVRINCPADEAAARLREFEMHLLAAIAVGTGDDSGAVGDDEPAERTLDVDIVLAEYLGALADLAGKSKTARNAKRNRERKEKQKQKKGRKKR